MEFIPGARLVVETVAVSREELDTLRNKLYAAIGALILSQPNVTAAEGYLSEAADIVEGLVDTHEDEIADAAAGHPSTSP